MKPKNEIFVTVYDWLVRNEMVRDQKDLAAKMNISQNTISRIMNGKVEPKDETLHRLNEAFDYIFNMQYLRGQSMYMLVEDMMYYEKHPEDNPLLPKQDARPNVQPTNVYADKLIASLEKRLEEKDEYIETLKKRIADLERTIASSKFSDLSAYPFPVGAAERKNAPVSPYEK